MSPEALESQAFDALRQLIVRAEGSVDWVATSLLLWRFGARPEVLGEQGAAVPRLGEGWWVLPADTRVPDHSIVQHLDLASAYAGVHPHPALLAVSIGPVQSFVRVARTTSDFWSGSNLLGALAWEAIAVVVERYGPDSIVVPNLRGAPLADLWLLSVLESRGGSLASGTPLQLAVSELKREEPCWESRSGDHPLLRASLPNRFVALVEKDEAPNLARRAQVRCAEAVEEWTRWALERHGPVAAGAGAGRFPTVHAAWVDLSGQPVQDVRAELLDALAAFGETRGEPEPVSARLAALGCGGEGRAGGGLEFFPPGPGDLYRPAYELLERVMGSTKTVRVSHQDPVAAPPAPRCGLCGERPAVVVPAPGGDDDREEPLCALCCLKREWPRVAAKRWPPGSAASTLAGPAAERWVPSTIALAQVPTQRAIIDRLGDRTTKELSAGDHPDRSARHAVVPAVARQAQDRPGLVAKFRAVIEDGSGPEGAEGPGTVGGSPWPGLCALARDLGIEGPLPMTAYYAIVQADGDRMGAWLSGTVPGVPRNRERLATSFAWHLERQLDQLDDEACRRVVDEWLEEPRPVSPAWHGAIATALNTFGAHVVPWLVEEVLDGKVVYAGGDDLLAMVPVDRVLAALWLLPSLYQGSRLRDPETGQEVPLEDVEAVATRLGLQGHPLGRLVHLRLGGGWVQVPRGGRPGPLRLAMGERATISVGVAVAHASYPLRAALREASLAEQRAKALRGAFCLSVLKRSGGIEQVTSRFPGPDGPGALGGLVGFTGALEAGLVSRAGMARAAQYLRELPPLAPELELEVLSELVARQSLLGADGQRPDPDQEGTGARRLAEASRAAMTALGPGAGRSPKDLVPRRRAQLSSMLAIAEFLGRGLRVGHGRVAGRTEQRER
ncbi:type III-B CRISPR-associated protein Cas10/Cmr2 [Aciditerrimonas ferrireducens]|uniref:type III-B CRISPR-associated protein Cas10/Cmr2 n=1 Tax=Aciditerrimonas ferrireducens TaxID=667306 RepID=UPI0020039E3B|nr:type III-B CRISPR-associated protein Cas10/Cmr2 [Aciditerrimonas ferrireducens]MCK4176162.1 type III-B CRISPR-associated protein Cas10/Cmr2 [Aciditerrimonas ferrireducens]